MYSSSGSISGTMFNSLTSVGSLQLIKESTTSLQSMLYATVIYVSSFVENVVRATIADYKSSKYLLHALHIKAPLRGSSILTGISSHLRKQLVLKSGVITSASTIVSHMTAFDVVGYVVLAVFLLWGFYYVAHVSTSIIYHSMSKCKHDPIW